MDIKGKSWKVKSVTGDGFRNNMSTYDFSEDEDGFRYPNWKMHDHFDKQLRSYLAMGCNIVDKGKFRFISCEGEPIVPTDEEFEFYVLSYPEIADYKLEILKDRSELTYCMTRKIRVMFPTTLQNTNTCDQCWYVTDWLTYVPCKSNYKGFWQLCRSCRQKCPYCTRFYFIGDPMKHVSGDCRYLPTEKLTKSL